MAAIPLKATTHRIYVDYAGNIWQLQGANTVVNVGAVPASPANTVAPIVSGTLTHGSTLSCTTGTWNPTGTYTYQWLGGGFPILNATNATYVTATSDIGRLITCIVTATTLGGAVPAISNAVGPVT